MFKNKHHKWFNGFITFVDFFLPRFCPSCQTKLTNEENTVCSSCLSKIRRADTVRLLREYERKFRAQNIISNFISLFVFEKDKELQQVIHELKYSGKFSLGSFLGKLTAHELGSRISEWNIDLILPVPLHHLKRAERGYNQSDFIAKVIGSILNIPVKTNLLKRSRFTETQTALTIDERRKNVRGAFSIKRKNNLSGKNILLLDDVITTGATISECGRLLLQNSAAKVYALSVAIAEWIVERPLIDGSTNSSIKI